jgi:hypothetical protein
MKSKKLGILATGALASVLILGSIGYAYGAPDEGTAEESGAVGVMKRAGGGLVRVVADLTGLDAADVAERRSDGESFAAIAESEGVSTDDVKSAAVEEFESHLDERLTSTEAPPEGHGRGGMRGMKGANPVETLAELTGLEASEIHEMRVAGTSFAAIAEAEGVDINEVIDTVIADAEERLQDAVDEGKLDADEAAERLTEMRERLEEMVNSTDELPERGPGMGRGSGEDSGTDS